MNRSTLLALALAPVAAGCLSTGNVIVADHQTVLEQQAAGAFPEAERDLQRAAIGPGPAPLTRGQLDAAGEPRPTEATLGDEGAGAPDRSRIDDLLVRRCLGEALDGTLVETRATCSAAVDAAALTRLVERENRGRWQLLRYLQSRRPGVPLGEIRRTWRTVHLESVVCGAGVEITPGVWEAKRC